MFRLVAPPTARSGRSVAAGADSALIQQTRLPRHSHIVSPPRSHRLRHPLAVPTGGYPLRATAAPGAGRNRHRLRRIGKTSPQRRFPLLNLGHSPSHGALSDSHRRRECPLGHPLIECGPADAQQSARFLRTHEHRLAPSGVGLSVIRSFFDHRSSVRLQHPGRPLLGIQPNQTRRRSLADGQPSPGFEENAQNGPSPFPVGP